MMDNEQSHQSEFAKALERSGYNFSYLRRRQERMANKAKRQAIASFAGSLLLLTGISKEATMSQEQWYNKLALGGEIVLSAAALTNSRNKVIKAIKFKRGAESSAYLAEVDNIGQNEITNATNTNSYA